MIGHDQIREALESRFTVKSCLFVGPPSVGKWTLAEHLVRVWEVPECDVIRVRSLTVDSAREVVEAARVFPSRGLRVILIRYDGASVAALNALLKVLEEPFSVTRFILVGTELPPRTVTSRCAVYQFSLLTNEEVKKVLLERRFSPSEATRLAKASGGSVRQALDLANDSEVKVLVLQAMKAILERDTDALDGVAARWTDEHTKVMGTLCREAISGRWGMFSAGEAEGVGKKLPLRILIALRPSIRPRLVVRSSLMSVLRG